MIGTRLLVGLLFLLGVRRTKNQAWGDMRNKADKVFAPIYFLHAHIYHIICSSYI